MHPSQHYEIARSRHVEKLVTADRVRLARATEAESKRRNPWGTLRGVLREHTVAVKPSPRPAA